MDDEGETRAGERATSAAGFAAHPLWWLLIVGAVVTAVVCVAFDHRLVGFDLGSLALLLALVFFIARAKVRSGMERETKWRKALPFELDEHVRVLGSGECMLEISFVGAMPQPAEWKQICTRFETDALAIHDDEYPHPYVRKCYGVRISRKNDSGGRAIRSSFHRFVDGELSALHLRYAIAHVVVKPQ